MSDFFDIGFSVREASWHGKATVLGDYPGREEAMRLAGHDFRVIEVPVFTRPTLLDRSGFPLPPSSLAPLEGWKALQKDTDDVVLNVVRDSYTVVQNDVLWDIVDAVVDQPNVKYETAGVLRDGAVLWVLARLDEPVTITGDVTQTYPYIACSTTHDGTGACTARNTSVRVICWNTHSMMEDETFRTGREFTFRHTLHVLDRIEEAKTLLRGTREAFASYVAIAEELAHISVTDSTIERFLVEFVPLPAADIVSDRVVANVETAREAIRDILNGPTTVTIRNTAYGLVQAGTEYLDHIRGYRNSDTYLGRTLLRPEPLKAKLVKLVRELAREDAVAVTV